jgi:hypothetical protein
MSRFKCFGRTSPRALARKLFVEILEDRWVFSGASDSNPSEARVIASSAQVNSPPVIISEYALADIELTDEMLRVFPGVTAAELRFVELYNASQRDVSLEHWSLQGDVELAFDESVVLAPGDVVVVVMFDPLAIRGQMLVTAFSTYYGINSQVRLVGPAETTVALDDSPDVSLVWFDPAEAEPEELVIDRIWQEGTADSIRLSDTYDGLDMFRVAVHRAMPGMPGALLDSWRIAPDSPGKVRFDHFPRGDLDGNDTIDSRDIDRLFAEVRNHSSLAFYDLNDDGQVNVVDVDAYLSATEDWQPFMFGLTAEALIKYAAYSGQVQQVVEILAAGADAMWDAAWLPQHQAFFLNAAQSRQQAPDLNLLIAPVFAWLYRETGDVSYRDRGDAIFAGGVRGAWLGRSKQFNQNYRWSFDFVRWRAEGDLNWPRTEGIASTPLPPMYDIWVDSMITLGHEYGEWLIENQDNANLDVPLSATYYDAIRVFYQIADFTSEPIWRDYARAAVHVYRDRYVLPANGGTPGYWSFSDGLLRDYLETGDPLSYEAVIRLSQHAAFAGDSTPLEWTEDETLSREVAYAMSAYMNAEQLTGMARARLASLADQAIGHVDQWFSNVRVTYFATQRGDANLDRVVDARDFAVWRDSYFSSQPGAWSAGDFNGDSLIDVQDFNIWLNHRFVVASPQSAPLATSRRTPRSALRDAAVLEQPVPALLSLPAGAHPQRRALASLGRREEMAFPAMHDLERQSPSLPAPALLDKFFATRSVRAQPGRFGGGWQPLEPGITSDEGALPSDKLPRRDSLRPDGGFGRIMGCFSRTVK